MKEIIVQAACAFNSRYCYELAMKFKTIGQVDKTVEYLTEATQIYPYHSQAHFELAKIYLERKEFDLARDRLDRVLLIDPQNAEAKLVYSSI